MRQVTFEELAEIVKRCTQYVNWKEYKAFADQFYPKAVKLTVTTYGEYNDEGGMDYRVESVTAYDSAGNILEPVHNLPPFEEWKVDVESKRRERWDACLNDNMYPKSYYSHNPDEYLIVDESDYEEYIEEIVQDERSNLPVEKEYEGEFTIVLVGDVPEMPRLFIEE